MKHIGNLQYADGAKGKDKRIGRGPGSGHGGTATRGNKGAQSRRNYKRKIAFEGGQMPMSRRVPKFGFFNPNRVEYQIINVGRIQEIIDDKVLSENKISPEILYNIGAISNRTLPVKILGNGELKTVVEIEAHKISAQAKQKIESVGGKVTIYG